MVQEELLSIAYFECAAVERVCSKLKPSFSSGPDGFPFIFFKQMAVYIAQPLSVTFNLIMQNGALPDIWKTAIVTPILKKGLASEPGNYRPISITCIACRSFERIVK